MWGAAMLPPGDGTRVAAEGRDDEASSPRRVAKAWMLGDAPSGQRSFIPNGRSSCLHGVLDLGRWFPKHRGSPNPRPDAPASADIAFARASHSPEPGGLAGAARPGTCRREESR